MRLASSNIKTLVKIYLPVFLCYYVFWGVQQVYGGNLTLNANWRYSDAKTTEDEFGQNYAISYSGRSYLTDNIRLTGNIRYNKLFREDFDSDYVAPSLSLINTNDIYRLNLGGNYTISRDSNGRDGESWNWSANLSSSWVNPLLPFLQTYYRQNGQLVDSETTSRSNAAGGLIRWGYWDWLGMQYHLDWREVKAVSENDTESERVTQRANLAAQKLFFDNRLSLGATVNYLQDDQDFSLPTEDGGFALLPLVVSQASYQETDDPNTGPLSNDASFLLTDEEPPVTLDIVPDNDSMNLGVRIDFQEVDVIYLGTLDDISVYANSFRWDVYSSQDGNDWVLEAANAPFVYNDIDQRFEFELDSLVDTYVKLVADTSLLLPVQVTEIESIEVFKKVFGDGEGDTINDERQRKNLDAAFNLGYLLMQNLRFSYNSSYQKNEDTQALEYEIFNNSAALTWTPSRYFSARLNASETRNDVEESPETMSRRYALSLSSAPLDTLSFSFGFTRREDYEADEMYSAIHDYTFYTTAQLYKDLSADLDFTYSDSVDGDMSDTFSERLEILARLSPTLILTLTQEFTENLDTNFKSYDNRFQLNWRLSEIMYLNNSLSISWDDDSDTLTVYGLSVGIAPNYKNRITLNYGLTHESGDIDQGISGTWNWRINRMFNFGFSGVYTIPEESDDNWQVSARLNYQYQN